MSAVNQPRVKGDEFREREIEAVAAARASVLDHVREKHEHAAAMWRNLADLHERDRHPGASAARKPDVTEEARQSEVEVGPRPAETPSGLASDVA